jgi:hypothetical protein
MPGIFSGRFDRVPKLSKEQTGFSEAGKKLF